MSDDTHWIAEGSGDVGWGLARVKRRWVPEWFWTHVVCPLHNRFKQRWLAEWLTREPSEFERFKWGGK